MAMETHAEFKSDKLLNKQTVRFELYHTPPDPTSEYGGDLEWVSVGVESSSSGEKKFIQIDLELEQFAELCKCFMDMARSIRFSSIDDQDSAMWEFKTGLHDPEDDVRKAISEELNRTDDEEN